jgi:NDP-sugar pyrophosphorylase family protein
MVSNGDVITDVKYGNIMDYHVANNASATMSVQLHTWQNPFGVVSTEGLSITKYEEKPVIKSLVNAGIYALNPEVLMLLNRNTPFDMPMLFQALIEKEMRTIAYPIHEIWMDLGDHASLNLANEITSK